MPEIHGSNTRIYANGLDISNLFQEAEWGRSRELVDTTAFTDTADTMIPSPVSAGDLNASGMWEIDHATGVQVVKDMLDASNDNLLGTSVVVCMTRDTTIGDDGFLLIGSTTNHRVKQPLKDVVRTTLEAKANRSLDVKSLHPLAARTAAHTTVGIDHGSATTYGGAAALTVTALSGTTPVLAAKLQHSSDSTNGVDGAWVDLASFATINAASVAAGYASTITPTGTINDWVRLVVTVSSGSLTSTTFACQFGRYTSNY